MSALRLVTLWGARRLNQLSYICTHHCRVVGSWIEAGSVLFSPEFLFLHQRPVVLPSWQFWSEIFCQDLLQGYLLHSLSLQAIIVMLNSALSCIYGPKAKLISRRQRWRSIKGSFAISKISMSRKRISSDWDLSVKSLPWHIDHNLRTQRTYNKITSQFSIIKDFLTGRTQAFQLLCRPQSDHCNYVSNTLTWSHIQIPVYVAIYFHVFAILSCILYLIFWSLYLIYLYICMQIKLQLAPKKVSTAQQNTDKAQNVPTPTAAPPTSLGLMPQLNPRGGNLTILPGEPVDFEQAMRLANSKSTGTLSLSVSEVRRI